MNKFSLILVCLLLTGPVLLPLAGCGPASPQIHHSLYAPDLVPHPAPSSGRMAILVGPVTIPDLLKTSQIVTGGAGGRYQLSDRHRWAGELDRDLARAIGEQLAGKLGTEQVAIYPVRQPLKPTHQVILEVLTMEGTLGKEATLAVRWSLVDPDSGTTRLTRRTVLSEQPADSGYDAWIAAQQRNIGRLGEEIAAAIAGDK